MNENAQNEQIRQFLQQQLRDIHLPDAVSWWPLAIGWWVVIALLASLMALGIYTLLKRKQRNAYRLQAQEELSNAYKQWLANSNTSEYLQSANNIVKRSLNQTDPENAHTHKTGKDWIKALNSFVDKPINDQLAHALTTAYYQAKPNVDVPNLHIAIKRYIETHKRPKTPKSKSTFIKGALIKSSLAKTQASTIKSTQTNKSTGASSHV